MLRLVIISFLALAISANANAADPAKGKFLLQCTPIDNPRLNVYYSLPVGVGIKQIIFKRDRAEVSFFAGWMTPLGPFDQNAGERLGDGPGPGWQPIDGPDGWWVRVPTKSIVRDGVPQHQIGYAVDGWWSQAGTRRSFSRIIACSGETFHEWSFFAEYGDEYRNTWMRVVFSNSP